MKHIITFALLFSLSCFSNSQAREQKTKTIINIDQEKEKVEIDLPFSKVEVSEEGDTIAKITLGQKQFRVIEENQGTHVDMVHIPRDKFKGHWAGFDLGFNNFLSGKFKTSLPAEDKFMELNAGKSTTVGINLIQYSIDLQKHKNTIGLVTGIGWSFYNYRLDTRNILIRDEDGNTTYRPSEKSVRKNKITTSYINVPLLLEFQIPTSHAHKRVFLSGGGYVGIKTGSHTKVVYNENGSKDKEKDRSNLNINPFQYGAMVRVGYKSLKLFASYNFSTLFRHEKGPELYPFTIGLTLVSF